MDTLNTDNDRSEQLNFEDSELLPDLELEVDIPSCQSCKNDMREFDVDKLLLELFEEPLSSSP